MRITLIHNPSAGEKHTSKSELLETLRRAGHQTTYHSAKSLKGEALDQALADPADLIVVAGGDGTVGKIARRLAGRDLPLAILPAGTANNIATALGVTGDATIQAPLWPTARRALLRIALAEGPWGRKPFVESVGCGLFAEAMPRHSEQARIDAPDGRHEELTHAREFLADCARTASPTRVQLTLDGIDHGGDYLLVEVMNIRCIGPNLTLAPAADPADGLLDILLVSPDHRRQLQDFVAGSNVPLPGLLRRAGRIELSVDACPLHIDDKSWPENHCEPAMRSGTITLTPGHDAIQILIP